MDDPIRVRASGVWELFDCALRWEAKHINHERLPSSPPAAIGTAVHASTAAFDLAVLHGSPISIDEAAGVAIDAIAAQAGDVEWVGMARAKAEETAMRVHTRYCLEIAPQMDYTAVEAELMPIFIDMGDGLVVELTGSLDRVYQPATKIGQGVADVKSGGRVVSADGSLNVGSHKPQLAVYELLGERTLGPMTEDALIIGLNTGSEPRVGIQAVPGARTSLTGDDYTKGLLEYAAEMLRSGLFPPNPSSFLCSERYCPMYNRCPYHA